jgi:Saxitoxin biosynthesis operon protein SxtJ
MAKAATRLNLHEDLNRHQPVEGSSDRSFGLVFAVVFALLALAPLRHHQPFRWWAAGGAGGFLVLALALPQVLRPLNAIWLRLGLLMGRIVTPITLGIMFFVVFTPIGWVMRVTNKNPLGLRRDPNARSYWIVRPSGENLGAGMSRQF